MGSDMMAPWSFLVIFFSQSEGGAPGYLSQKGEDAALNLTDVLSAFLKDSLNLDLENQLMFVCGSQVRSLKTAEFLSTRLAVPFTVDGRWDRSPQDLPAVGTLKDVLEFTIFELVKSKPTLPKVLLVGTALPALHHWIAEVFMDILPDPVQREDKVSSFHKTLNDLTQNGQFPTVVICGAEVADGKIHWVFD